MSRQGKELARPNSLSYYEQLAEAVRNFKMCSDNPDMQATRCTGGGRELPDIQLNGPCLKVGTPMTDEWEGLHQNLLTKNAGC
jgi:hypothetical protein